MDELSRIAIDAKLDAKLDKREFDSFKVDNGRALDRKANTDDVTVLAVKVSRDDADHAEHRRTIKARFDDVDKAMSALRQAMVEDTGGPIPRRSFIYRIPPPILAAGSLLAGGVAMKSPEMLHALMKFAGSQ